MTQRHADSDDETYVTVGRPFERLETAEDVHKAKARKDKDQYVTDSQGRRRFHGAFTGGFSAGYYNTVGSEEGWAPSSFVSSRGKRSEFGGQRPEDFMDEEDFGAHGIAPKVVSTKDQFIQSQGEDSRKRPQTDSGVIPGVPPLQNLVVPSKNSVGARLLKAMGWKEGEGVGPKVVKYQPRQESPVRVYGPARPEEPSKVAEGVMFAPRDSTPWEFSGKDDLHGLDYRGMDDRGVLAPRKSTKSLYGMSGEAFGTGALEDEDDDDENVYGVESMTSYDVSLAGEGDLNMERSFGWTGRETDTWDLSSFTKALKKPPSYKSHPPPSVPKTFVPLHKFNNSAATDTSVCKPLTSTNRSQLLSDNAGSVFELLSASDRERLKHATEHAKTKPDAHSTTGAHTKEQPVADSGKSVTEWESGKQERMARAAAIYKPLSESLASRFTRSQDQAEPPKSPESDAIQAARASMFGALTREVQSWHPHRLVCKRFNVPDPYPGQSLVGLADGKEKGAEKNKNRAINFELTEKMVTIENPEQESFTLDEGKNQGKDEVKDKEKDKEEEVEEAARPPMDLFKAIFANSDSSSSGDDSDDGQSTVLTSSVTHSQEPYIPSGRQEKSQSSSEKRWKDLSVITSHVEQMQETDSLDSRHQLDLYTVKQDIQAQQLLSGASAKHHPSKSQNKLQPHVTSYGPSIPPDIYQQSDSDEKQMLSTSVHRRHSHREKHKKKHKKDGNRDHKEHKKRKHKHSKH